jgi:hypothetical protein
MAEDANLNPTQLESLNSKLQRFFYKFVCKQPAKNILAFQSKWEKFGTLFSNQTKEKTQKIYSKPKTKAKRLDCLS